MHWLVCKMNLPFHYYLLTVLVFHLYGFFFFQQIEEKTASENLI